MEQHATVTRRRKSPRFLTSALIVSAFVGLTLCGMAFMLFALRAADWWASLRAYVTPSPALDLASADETGDPLEAPALVRLSQVGDLVSDQTAAHMLVDITYGQRGTTAVADVLVRKDTQGHMMLRAQLIESSLPDYLGLELATDGEQFWLYNPTRNLFWTGDVDILLDDWLPGMFLLPVQSVSLTAQGADPLSLNLLFDFSNGSHTLLNGQPVREVVIRLAPALPIGESPCQDVATSLWLDADGVPWQGELYHQAEDATRNEMLSYTISSLDWVPAPVDMEFRLFPPEQAQIIDLSDTHSRHVSLQQANALMGTVLAPDDALGAVPLGVTMLGEESVVQRYISAQHLFTVTQTTILPAPWGGSVGSAVKVRGRDGWVISQGDAFTTLSWQEGTTVYLIAGVITPQEALQVAESLQPVGSP
jgi:hypothetical protein